MLAAIMTDTDFGEIMFLVAFIIFILAVIIDLTNKLPYAGPLVAAGLACTAFGFLAL